MKKVVAFADEFGNNSFNFKEQGSHFIIASVIINNENIKSVQIQLETIRKKYFQTGEIKSQKVSKNHKRRLLILKDLQSIKFNIYSVVVDKRKLYGEGFKYKRSFYKFLNGVLYKELYRTYPQLELKVDEHGGNDFMKSFKSYVQNNHIRNLFSGSEFIVKKSHNDLGVQLADFIAGTLGYIFDENKKSEKSDEFYKLIEPKLISINTFPKEYDTNKINETETDSEYDKTIASLSLNRIYDYIDKVEVNKQYHIDKINFLKLLLLFHQSKHHKKYTTASEFIRHLNVNRNGELNKESFSSKIVASLRDNGVLIASSRNGYKIPTSAEDLKKYINHGKKIIFPLLNRIQQCREIVLLATNNEYDLLNEEEFIELKKIIDS